MSNKTFNAKNNKARKGISPVIATVILVAVAVVIAAALAGFSGSLFSSYSQGPQVKVTAMTLAADGAGSIDFSNTGSTADTVSSVAITNHGTVLPAGMVPTPAVINANANSVTVTLDGFTTLTAGQQVTATITMQSGASITHSVTVSP